MQYIPCSEALPCDFSLPCSSSPSSPPLPPPDKLEAPPGVKLEEQPADPKATKIVLVAGSNYFKPGEHEYVAGCAVLADLLRQTPGVAPVLAVDWPKKPETFAGAKAVVFFFDGGDKHAVLKGDRLRSCRSSPTPGSGWCSCTRAATSRRTSATVRGWAGGGLGEGLFAAGPLGRRVQDFPDHPIFRGVTPFKIDDGWLYKLGSSTG